MTDKFLEFLSAMYSLTEIDTGEWQGLRASGMKFDIRAYKAEGLGHISVMRASGFFGLMRMDTLIINPTKKDLPLYSYDRIYAMGNDTLITELYDTAVGDAEISALDKIKSSYADIVERDAGEHWYDSIKLAQSISKKGKKRDAERMDKLADEHFRAYITAECDEVTDDIARIKAEKTASYVDGLLQNGGPSTDVFKKKLGAERTAKLFREILFGTAGL